MITDLNEDRHQFFIGAKYDGETVQLNSYVASLEDMIMAISIRRQYIDTTASP